MGGSYERVQNDSKNAMLRQRAQLLLQLELLMSQEDRENLEHSPTWIYWYRAKERESTNPIATLIAVFGSSTLRNNANSTCWNTQ